MFACINAAKRLDGWMDGWLINNYPPMIRQKYLKLTPETGLSFVLIDAGAAVQSLYRKQANFERRAKSTSVLDRKYQDCFCFHMCGLHAWQASFLTSCRQAAKSSISNSAIAVSAVGLQQCALK